MKVKKTKFQVPNNLSVKIPAGATAYSCLYPSRTHTAWGFWVVESLEIHKSIPNYVYNQLAIICKREKR
jgi:hypothetical protein